MSKAKVGGRKKEKGSSNKIKEKINKNKVLLFEEEFSEEDEDTPGILVDFEQPTLSDREIEHRPEEQTEQVEIEEHIEDLPPSGLIDKELPSQPELSLLEELDAFDEDSEPLEVHIATAEQKALLA